MDIILDLIREVISTQTAVLEGMRNSATEWDRQAAAYFALAAKLEAERTAVQKCFEQYQADKVRFYKSANSVLDEAIKSGNVAMAAVATRVIDLTHSKTIFMEGVGEE